ncbi:MAG: hypothetical protein AAFZ65_21215, partial [Planctomycetota bacterium]
MRTLPIWLAVLAAPSAAQVALPGGPIALPATLDRAVPTETLPAIDLARLEAEDAQAGRSGPWRFGVEIPTQFDLADSGAWTLGADGERVWRLRLSAPGAASISLEFDAWVLPEGASVCLYDDARETVYGSYGAHNNKPDGQMAILPFPGDALTIEYVEPAELAGEAQLSIGTVVHGYRDVFARIAKQDEQGSFAGSGSCNVDINCPDGAEWQDEKRAVARTFTGGFLCTGALINNTAQDGTQYFLSANHCGSMNSTVFLFNYERTGCGSGSVNGGQSVQGSSLVATGSSSDYRLVRINSNIPDSYGVYFAGWNRSSQAPSGSVGIHHPSGDTKKICFDFNAPTKSGSNWRIANWELGVTEGGSSGSPLFNPDGQIIGQLCCGQAFCGFPVNDYYGRFELAWNAYSSSLDPIGSGATSIGGWDPNGGGGTPPVVPCSVTAYGAGAVANIGTLS